jgi:hypothetical protein
METNAATVMKVFHFTESNKLKRHRIQQPQNALLVSVLRVKPETPPSSSTPGLMKNTQPMLVFRNIWSVHPHEVNPCPSRL